MDSRDLEVLESERFGPTRSLSEHLASLEQERGYIYAQVIPPSEPSRQSVELMRREWSRIRFKQWQLDLVRKIMRGKEHG